MTTNTTQAGASWTLPGTIIAAFAASACCIGPLVLLALGVGGASASWLSVLEPYRPIFIVVTVSLLAFAFFKAYRPATGAVCSTDGACAMPNSRRKERVVLWLVTPVVLGFLLFPYFASALVGGADIAKEAPVNPSAETKEAVLKVDGMTCASCTVTVKKSLVDLPGVMGVTVTLKPDQAVVNYDASKTSTEKLVAATKAAGYPSSVSAPTTTP